MNGRYALAAAAMLAALPASAQEAAAPKPGSDPLVVSLSPYAWATSLDGHVGVRGYRAKMNMDFQDIIDDLNGALMLEADFRKGAFQLVLNSVFAQLEDSAASARGRVSVKAKVNEFIQDAYAGYWVGGFALKEGGWAWEERDSGAENRIALMPYGGIRYTYLDSEVDGKLDLERLGRTERRTVSGSQQWAAPIAGVRANIRLGGAWELMVQGDGGGLSNDNYTWQGMGVLGYRFGLGGSVTGYALAGYRYLDQNYVDGGFEWDVTTKGPVVGLTIQF
ncbi:MAG: hypothetical protein U1E14_06705 [Geminicoccaceae bacterium]